MARSAAVGWIAVENSKHWFTTSILQFGGRCRKAMIEVCSCSSGRDGDLGVKVRGGVRWGGGGGGGRM